MKKILNFHEFPIIIFTLVMIVVFSILSSNFLEISNFQNIFSQVTVMGIIAIGMTMVILFGGMDLSVGSVLALVATIVGLMISNGVNIFIAIIVGTLVGATCGAINGLVITQFNIPDIIATLATMYIFRGIAVFISGGTWITNFPSSFSYFSQGMVLGIPFGILVLFILAIIFALALKYTRFGRRIYALGGNFRTAQLNGMPVKKTKFSVYVLSGMLSSIAAVIYASNVGSIQASTVAENLSFDVIAAVLIGGASIFGGTGTILGTMFGVLLLGVIQNGVVISQFSAYWVDAVSGLLIIVAIIMNSLKRWRDNLRTKEKLE